MHSVAPASSSSERRDSIGDSISDSIGIAAHALQAQPPESAGLDGPVAAGLNVDPEDPIGPLIRRHRDWRIDTDEPQKSVVFMSGGRQGQLAPVSGSSAVGHALLPAFFALSGAIEAHRRRFFAEATGSPTPLAEPRSFAIVVQGVRCRVQKVQENRYHVRVPTGLLPMSSLGMPEKMKSELLSSDLEAGGLVVVCGSYGSGKTSTVNAVVRERIARRGGYALCMGNPIEYAYAGFHGSTSQPGYIEQIDLEGLDLDAEIRASMRNFPAGATSLLAYPELVGPAGAGEMLRAANRGNLVFADMHAINIEASLLNLVAMAEQDGERNARDLLANCLRMVIHQTLHSVPRTSFGSNSVERSNRGVAVSYKSVTVTRSMRAAISDRSMPLSRALLAVVNAEAKG